MIDSGNERRIQPPRENGANLNANAIQKLAQELGLPVDVAQRMYEEVLKKLDEEAKIRALLPIFISRHGKKHCR